MEDVVQQADVAIIGAGQAGSEVATRLRQQGFEGSIVLIGEEAWLPYRRPPLSKDYLSGRMAREALFIRTAEFYAKQNITCLTGVSATRIDRAMRRIQLSDGSELAYSRLVLATGGRARNLPDAWQGRANVHRIRSINDIDRLRDGFRQGARLLVIGAGYVGLEVAAAAATAGLQVTVVETAPRVLARVATPVMSEWFAALHQRHGVDIRTGRHVAVLEGDARVTRARLDDGSEVSVDLVVVGIGMLPNTELAEAAGLPVEGGVLVDAAGLTADPAIWAAGDCTQHQNDFYPGKGFRVESVPNALEQARIVAENLLGRPARHASPPWFWSDQYDAKLQMVGIVDGVDQQVWRGHPDSGAFMLFHLRGEVPVAVEAFNRPQEFMVARQLVAGRVRVDVAALQSETVSLRSLLPSRIA